MATVASLAAEFGAQPHEVAAFADLGADYRDDEELDQDTEAMIRDAWAHADGMRAPGEIGVVEENRANDRLMDEVAYIVDRAGYDY